MKSKPPVSRFGIALAAVGASMILASSAAYIYWLPDVSPLVLENPKTTAYIEHYVRLAKKHGKKPVVLMRWARLSEMSPYLRRAVVIAEDDSFYQHGGVDWDALVKAIAYDRKKGRYARGASTITQQVGRNLYLSPEKSALRKIKEIAIAWKLENALTKDRILEIYLNIAEWGKGIYGAQAASQIYFEKDAADLSPGEAAALAAALPSPWRRNPSHPEQEPRLARKKGIILERMRKAGYLPLGVSEEEVELPGFQETSADPRKSFPSLSPQKSRSVPSIPCGGPQEPSSPSVKDEPADSCGGSKAKPLISF